MKSIVLYEREPEHLRPLSWLRPVWDFRVGARTILERLEALAPNAEFHFAGRPEVTRSLAQEHDVQGKDALFLEAGAVATKGAWAHLLEQRPPIRLESGGEFVGAWVGKERTVSVDALATGAFEEEARAWPVREWTGPLVRTLPDLIANLVALIESDLELAAGQSSAPGEGVTVLGNHPVHIASDARIDPGTTLDARDGAISIGSQTSVSFHTWLKGPAAIGERNHLLGGTIGPLVATGPVCKIRGEVAETFIQGYTNKAHDGFIGHSYLGEWVNLGAMTTCSDLKNNYGNVRLDTPRGTIDSGLNKLGVFLGDHAKTAIGTLLSTGTIVGTGANVFGGGGLSPKAIPMFAWGVDGTAKSYALDRFLETAKAILARRDVGWSDTYETRLRETYGAAE